MQNEKTEKEPNKTIKQKLEDSAELVNAQLKKHLSLGDPDYDVLYESMRYTALSGGKRIRAFLTLEFFSLVSGEADPAPALTAAAAIELVHAYSLIHDDLPCMDDDDMRRGLPSNHKKFGEATALLSGDALLTLAFGIIADDPALKDSQKVGLVSELAQSAGHMGMIGGQMMDILPKDKDNKDKLVKMHMLKTASLITAAAKAGCIAGNAGKREMEAATHYAQNLGLAFQLVDDRLDGENFISDPFACAQALTARAVCALSGLNNAKNLEEFAYYLLKRKN
ncbi:MAG: polyprenyl synthetase family protein [Oscillospiraceae bacterium]|nr:polyprenyl synthetase family protein [Oscillospiraceae bacterium]